MEDATPDRRSVRAELEIRWMLIELGKLAAEPALAVDELLRAAQEVAGLTERRDHAFTLDAALLRRRRVEAAITRKSKTHGLTARQTLLVRHAIDGASHRRLAALLEISEQASRNLAGQILRKTGAESLRALVLEISMSIE